MKTRMNGQKAFLIGCGALTILLVIFLSLLFSMRAESRSRTAALFDNSVYEEKEANYKRSLESALAEAGYSHSGITLTHTVSLDEARSYRVEIHNSCFSYMEASKRTELVQRLNALSIMGSMGETLMVEVVLTGAIE